MKRVVVLGSTGSVGVQTLDVLANHREAFHVAALAADRNDALLELQARQLGVGVVALHDEEAAERLQRRNPRIHVLSGPEGILELAAVPSIDTVAVAIGGPFGLPATLAAIGAGKQIALARGILVAAGELITYEAARAGVRIKPLSSEHGAIYQCLQGQRRQDVRRVYLMSSGGPFRNVRSLAEMEKVTVEQVLASSNWETGARSTVDSATLASKGLDVIEGHWLFDIPYDDIHVVLHGQSAVHGAVELVDGSILAQMGTNDLRPMAQYALSHPTRLEGHYPTLDLAGLGALTFEPARPDLFPCLAYAYQAGRMGGTATAVFHAANEVVVEHYLARRIQFLDIPSVIRRVLDAHAVEPATTLEAVLRADREARLLARQEIAILEERRSWDAHPVRA